MDARTKKRVDSVQHIKSKPYFRPGIEQDPDPFDETCSTRMWRFKMKVWVETMKAIESSSCRNKNPPRPL